MFDYSKVPAWVMVADIACWVSLIFFAGHYFTCST